MQLSIDALSTLIILGTFLSNIDAARFIKNSVTPIIIQPTTKSPQPESARTPDSSSISDADISDSNISDADISDRNISKDDISNFKISKYNFLANVTYEEEGLNSVFTCLATCLKEISSKFETKIDEKCRKDGNEINDPQVPHGRLPIDPTLLPTPQIISDQLIENIVLNKPRRAAPSYEYDKPTYQPYEANDGSLISHYHSDLMTSPWWIVSMGNTYKVVKINYYARPLHGSANGHGVQFYVADNIHFNSYGIPDITNLTMFSQRTTFQLEEPGSKSVHEVPEGHFGTHILVIKPVINTYLQIDEIQVAGYLYE